jgi:hypothetical protein
MFGLAVLYSLVNLSPWDRIRGWIDIVDRQNWSGFWLYAAGVWLLLLGVLPLLLYLLTRAGLRLSGSNLPAQPMFRVVAAALVPLGLSLWASFVLSMFSSMLTFVLQSLSDPLNWGWDILGRAGSPWQILWAPGIPWLQVACVAIGLVYSLRTLDLGRRDLMGERREAVLAALPPAAFLWLEALAMVCFYAG